MVTHATTATQDILEQARRILAGSEMAPVTATSTCCSSAKQEVCCEPSEKADCCGGSATAAGGCGCQ